MSLFHIQELIHQDEKGITYLALDAEKHYSLSLRRFFPFIEKRSGLAERDQNLFEALVDKLRWVGHDRMRHVVSGGIDPIDQVPYIVTPWYQGDSLAVQLNGSKVPAKHIVQMLLTCFEISALVSCAIGEEGVWVEADINYAIIGDDKNFDKVSFNLSPHKLLRIQQELKRPISLLQFAHDLADQNLAKQNTKEAKGLLAWMDWQQRNPGANLQASYEYLCQQTSKPMPAPQNFSYPASINTITSKDGEGKLTTILIAIFALICIGMVAYLLTNDSDTKPAANSISAVKKQQEPERSPSVNPKISNTNELADQLRNEGKTLNPTQTTQPKPNVTLSVEKTGVFDRTPPKSNVLFEGTLQRAQLSATGKTLFLDFTYPVEKNTIRLRSSNKGFDAQKRLKEFEKLIGKKLSIRAVRIKYTGRRYLDFKSIKDIEVL